MRLADWDARLVETMARHQAMPFTWGLSDCARLMADSVRAMTGRDPLAHAPAWQDVRTAVLALRALGVRSVQDIIASSFEEIPPEVAVRGDLASPWHDPQPLASPAIVLGPEMISREERRFVVLPTALAVRAWRVA